MPRGRKRKQDHEHRVRVHVAEREGVVHMPISLYRTCRNRTPGKHITVHFGDGSRNKMQVSQTREVQTRNRPSKRRSSELDQAAMRQSEQFGQPEQAVRTQPSGSNDASSDDEADRSQQSRLNGLSRKQYRERTAHEFAKLHTGPFDMGHMCVECKYCDAMLWVSECNQVWFPTLIEQVLTMRTGRCCIYRSDVQPTV